MKIIINHHYMFRKMLRVSIKNKIPQKICFLKSLCLLVLDPHSSSFPVYAS
eukprot:UN09080